jgi:hypothetical protein
MVYQYAGGDNHDSGVLSTGNYKPDGACLGSMGGTNASFTNIMVDK